MIISSHKSPVAFGWHLLAYEMPYHLRHIKAYILEAPVAGTHPPAEVLHHRRDSIRVQLCLQPCGLSQEVMQLLEPLRPYQVVGDGLPHKERIASTHDCSGLVSERSGGADHVMVIN
jgi:hypothetical protein